MRHGFLIPGILAVVLFDVMARADEVVPQPILLMLDASASMKDRVGSQRKIDMAKEVILPILSGVPGNQQVALIAFGHRKPADCSDIELLEPIGRADAEKVSRMQQAVLALDAIGVTPTAGALDKAVSAFDGKPGRIILVTDGGEECGVDVCKVGERLAKAAVRVRVDVVGFGLSSSARSSLTCITEDTGGRFHDADSKESLAAALEKSFDDVPGGKLRVTVTEGAKGKARVPTVVVRSDKREEASLVGNPVLLRLPPGAYSVNATVGDGEASGSISVEISEGGVTDETIDLGAGTLAVTVSPGGGKPFPSKPVIELWRPGQPSPVASRTDTSARLQVQAGTYTIRVSFPNGQMKEFPNIEIRAGETTEKMVEVPSGNVTVTVSGRKYSPGRTPFPLVEVLRDGVFVTALSGNPARFQLLSGTYTLVVRDSPIESDSRTVELRPGDSIPVELKIP